MIFALSIAFFSLLVGSFINVVIYRLPRMIDEENTQACQTLLGLPHKASSKPINLCFPRSFCPSCKKQISALSNIPLISYLLQKGRCKYCKAAISARYPLVEFFSMLLAFIAAQHFGPSLALCFALLFIWLTLPLFFIDLQHQILPDGLTLGLLWIGLIANTQNTFTSLNEAVWGALSAYLALWVVLQGFYLLTGKKGIGHGDLKLFAALGAWFGLLSLPLLLLIASISGAVIGSVYLKWKSKGKNTPIPFGPFLILSGTLVLFWGESLLEWCF